MERREIFLAINEGSDDGIVVSVPDVPHPQEMKITTILYQGCVYELNGYHNGRTPVYRKLSPAFQIDDDEEVTEVNLADLDQD